MEHYLLIHSGEHQEINSFVSRFIKGNESKYLNDFLIVQNNNQYLIYSISNGAIKCSVKHKTEMLPLIFLKYKPMSEGVIKRTIAEDKKILKYIIEKEAEVLERIRSNTIKIINTNNLYLKQRPEKRIIKYTEGVPKKLWEAYNIDSKTRNRYKVNIYPGFLVVLNKPDFGDIRLSPYGDYLAKNDPFIKMASEDETMDLKIDLNATIIIREFEKKAGLQNKDNGEYFIDIHFALENKVTVLKQAIEKFFEEKSIKKTGKILYHITQEYIDMINEGITIPDTIEENTAICKKVLQKFHYNLKLKTGFKI